ncbi:MAG: protein kinase [Bradymonadaceae bacterium]
MKICPECLMRVGDEHEVCPDDGSDLREIHAREEDPIEGRIFDETWVVEKRIGGGGMGTVYRGHQLSVDRTVAIKVLRSSLCEDDEHVERFFREAQVASDIDDPRCVTIHDFGQASTQDRALYLAMEYLEGASLRERMRGDDLTLQETLAIGIEVCEALETLHDEQVVHRDLKPENIFLVDEIGEEIFVKLLDFGLAKALDSDQTPVTKSGDIFGTPDFMSPEQCMDEEVDHRADLYALGCILYQIISGRAPFARGARVETLLAHVNEEPSKLDGPAAIPASFEQAIMRALSKEPADRFQSASQFRQRLETIREDVWGDSSVELPVDAVSEPDEVGVGGDSPGETIPREGQPTREYSEALDQTVPADLSDEAPTPAASPGADDEPGESPTEREVDREEHESANRLESRALAWVGAAVLAATVGILWLTADRGTSNRTGLRTAVSTVSARIQTAEESAARRVYDVIDGTRRRANRRAQLIGQRAVAASAALAAVKTLDKRSESADPTGATPRQGGELQDVPGVLTRKTASRVFESKNPAVQRCLESSLGPDAGTSAVVELELTVTGGGEVSSVSVRESRGRDADVDCVVDLAENWSFPPTPAGKPVRLVHRYAFSFEWKPLD